MKKNFKSKPSKEGNRGSKQGAYFKGKNYKQKEVSSKSKKSREVDEDTSSYSKTNDVSWYITDNQMLSDIGNIPFSYAAGKLYNTGEVTMNMNCIGTGGSTTPAPIDSGTVFIPGACVLYTRPSLPRTTEHSDPVNQAGWKIVSFLKHTISASLPYEGPDVMAMLIGMANVYSYFNFCSRAYAITGLYSNLNRYLPDSLLASMGIDPLDFKDNLADFRRGVNQLIRKAATLSIPSNLKYFQRTAFMFSNIYTGGTAIQDQLYYYTPEGFWRYSEVGTNGAGLIYTPFIINDTVSGSTDIKLRSHKELLEYGKSLMEGLFSSDDIVMISANILRAYGTAGTLKLELLPDEAQIAPIFDIGVLEQIANANPIPKNVISRVDFKPTSGELAGSGWDLIQTVSESVVASMLKWDPYFRCNNNSDAGTKIGMSWLLNQSNLKHIINTTTKFTGPDLVVESTRLKTTGFINQYEGGFNVIKVKDTDEFDASTTTTKRYEGHLETGTEAIVQVKYYYCTAGTYVNLDPGYASYYANWIDHKAEFLFPQGDASTINEWIIKLSIMANFRFRPQSYITTFDGASVSDIYKLQPTNTHTKSGRNIYGYHLPLWDLDNIALVDRQQLRNINEAATYTMFNIESVSNAYRG